MESKGHISNIFGRAYRIKVKISGHHEGDIQLTKRQHIHATTATTVITTNNDTLLLELPFLQPP